MTVEVGAMLGSGIATLAVGLGLAWPRVREASCAGRMLALAPVFEATPLAIFAAEHFTTARAMAPIVPRWLPDPVFWVYFFGVALSAAAISFILRRCVRWSAALLALFFLLVVLTVDLPDLGQHLHERLFWTLLARETCFGAGALVLAGSTFRPGSAARAALVRIGRGLLAPILVFYAIEHFLFPRFVPGVPLMKLIPAWVPAPTLLACCIGIVLLLTGIALLIRPTIRIAATACGTILLLLTAFFYLPICVMEFHTALAVEGINYIGDTMLFAATILLAGLATDPRSD